MTGPPPISTRAPRVAVVHDWLLVYAGAERVLEQIVTAFPEADVFALIDFLPEELRHFIRGKRARTTFIQRLPAARRHYRRYLPLMPLAIESLDVSEYDLVLSSSYAVAKGVITTPGQLHVSYVHSPMRYAWDLQEQYLRQTGLDQGVKGWLARWLLSRSRAWDLRTANRANRLVANSKYIRERIRRVYGRDADVIYPPVDVGTFALESRKEDYYFTASRMVPYKRVDLIVEAFAEMGDRQLVVAGDGPEVDRVKARAGRNVDFVGHCDQIQLRSLMQRARAFVFAAEEDFGIAPVEAQACGTPVIAFERGGATESIRGLSDPKPTGVFFPEQTVAALVEAVERFEGAQDRIVPEACRENALRFSPERFRREYVAFVDAAWREFVAGRARAGAG